MINDVMLGATQVKALYLGETLVWERFSLTDLFSNGQQGVLYEPWDKTSLWQDEARTVPVTANGDPVRVMLDKSGNGNHAVAPNSSSRAIYQTDGILHWLKFDGVDDSMSTSTKFDVSAETSISMAASKRANSESNLIGFLTNNFNRLSIPSINTGRVGSYFRNSAGFQIGSAGAVNVMSIGKRAVVSLVLSNSELICFRYKGDVTRDIMTDVVANSVLANVPFYIGGDSLGEFFGAVAILGKNIEGSNELRDVEGYLAAKAGVTL